MAIVNYDSEIYADYLNKDDYLGAKNYLQSLTVTDSKKLAFINEQSKILDRKHSIYNSMINSFTPEDRSAYIFINELHKGIIPRTTVDENGKTSNPYGSDYGDFYLNKLNNTTVTSGDHAGKRIKGYSIDLLDQSIEQNLLNIYGVNNPQDLSKFGIRVDWHDGHRELNYYCSDEQLARHLYYLQAASAGYGDEAVGNLEDRMMVELPSLAIGGGVAGAAIGAAVGSPAGPLGSGAGAGVGAKIGAAVGIASGVTDYIYQRATLNTDGYEVWAILDDGSVTQVDGAEGNVNDYATFYKDALDKATRARRNYDNRTFVNDTYIVPFLGQGHVDAHNALANGQISSEQYNQIVKDRTYQYEQILKMTDLSDADIYFNITKGENLAYSKSISGIFSRDNNTDESSFKPDNNLELADKRDNVVLSKILRTAIKEDRVTFGAAYSGGMNGTYITISAKANSKGEFADGIEAQEITMFIPGLFEDSVNEVLQNDSKYKASTQALDLERNYGIVSCPYISPNIEDFGLQNVNRIGFNDSGFYKLNYDIGKNEPISKQEALHFLNRTQIYNDCVNALLYNSNINIANYNYDIYSNENFMKQANALAQAATDELYPKSQFSEEAREAFKNDFAGVIAQTAASELTAAKDRYDNRY